MEGQEALPMNRVEPRSAHRIREPTHHSSQSPLKLLICPMASWSCKQTKRQIHGPYKYRVISPYLYLTGWRLKAHFRPNEQLSRTWTSISCVVRHPTHATFSRNDQVNDFAHIPWEDTPNFPKPPKRKNFFINLWWNIRGTFQGYVGEILDQGDDQIKKHKLEQTPQGVWLQHYQKKNLGKKRQIKGNTMTTKY